MSPAIAKPSFGQTQREKSLLGVARQSTRSRRDTERMTKDKSWVSRSERILRDVNYAIERVLEYERLTDDVFEIVVNNS